MKFMVQLDIISFQNILPTTDASTRFFFPLYPLYDYENKTY